ncbi:hypothetical protein N431DRAFT_426129 [Stipitochalara longipes BDJ]|nr:hypothetical protein N431DRAFT_426129 [Stipitochalara longipes BDJ]
MFWDCCTKNSAELLPAEVIDEDGKLKKVAPYPESSEASDITQAWVYTNYNRLIERYTECNFIFGSDKLVAFSGLARRLSSITSRVQYHPCWTVENDTFAGSSMAYRNSLAGWPPD